MRKTGNTIGKIANWLNTGTAAQRLLKKILAVCAGILIVYHAGYGIGKLLFHTGV